MRGLTIVAILLLLCACNQGKKQTIVFKPVSEDEFNFIADSSFAVPHGQIWDERKRVHDSCMGDSYTANALFMRTRDTFRIGSIADKKTMKVVKNLGTPGNLLNTLDDVFTFETKPCYEKRPLNIPVDSFMNNSLFFMIDSFNIKFNNELRQAIKNSIHTEIETGSWMNMELTDALGKILDTTSDERLLEYKKALLMPGNMILVRSSAITEMSFYFDTKKPISNELKNKLLTSPVSSEKAFFKAQFFYIDDDSFRLKLDGFFQIASQFMKCELE